jgi:hypothetical protein
MPTPSQTAFQEDLANPAAGLDTDLYHAIAPIVSSNVGKLKGYDAERIKALREHVRKGVVGLEYLTGTKSNKGKTFYDEHPTQSVLSDILKQSPTIGLGVAAGGAATNYLRQMQNMMATEKAQMARANNPLDPSNPTNLLDSSRGPLREDIARTFGELSDDLKVSPELRFRRLDDLERRPVADMRKYPGEFNMLEAQRSEAIDNFRKQYSATQKEQLNALSRAKKGEPIEQIIKDLNIDPTDMQGGALENLDSYYRSKLKDLDIGYGTAMTDYKTKVNDLMRTLEPHGYAPQYRALEMQKSIISEDFNRKLEQLMATGDQKPKKTLQEQYASRISEIEQAQKNLISQARQSPAQAKLKDYANFMESYKRKRDSGKPFKSYIGEDLHELKNNPAVQKFLQKKYISPVANKLRGIVNSLVPGKNQAIGDLLEKGNITGADKYFNEGLVSDIIKEINGGKDFSSANPAEHMFANTTLRDIKNPNFQSSGLRRTLRRAGLPLAAGAGIALGGSGLYALVRAIQNKAFEDEQIKEWKKTLLKSRGDFDAAERIN